MHGSSCDTNAHAGQEPWQVASGKDQSVTSLIKIRQGAAQVAVLMAADTATFLVVDHAFRGIAQTEPATGAHNPIQLLKVEKVVFRHQAPPLQKSPSDEHRCPLDIIQGSRASVLLFRGPWKNWPSAASPAVVPSPAKGQNRCRRGIVAKNRTAKT